MPRISGKLPLTTAEWQAVTREFGVYTAGLPTDDAEWQATMRLMGLEDKAGPFLPTTDAEWQTYFVRVVG